MENSTIKNALIQYFPDYNLQLLSSLDRKYSAEKLNGLLVNTIVRTNLESRYIISFVNTVLDTPMRESELMILYIQLVNKLIRSPHSSVTCVCTLADIRNKIRNFDEWIVVFAGDGINALDAQDMFERGGVYDISYINSDQHECSVYICMNSKYPERSVNNYILRNFAVGHQNRDVINHLTEELILTNDVSTLDIIPETLKVQESFMSYQGCVIDMEKAGDDFVNDAIKTDGEIIYWYHNGHKIICHRHNKFNMLDVNEKMALYIAC